MRESIFVQGQHKKQNMWSTLFNLQNHSFIKCHIYSLTFTELCSLKLRSVEWETYFVTACIIFFAIVIISLNKMFLLFDLFLFDVIVL